MYIHAWISADKWLKFQAQKSSCCIYKGSITKLLVATFYTFSLNQFLTVFGSWWLNLTNQLQQQTQVLSK